MPRKVSVKGVAQREQRLNDKVAEKLRADGRDLSRVADSFQNFALKLGMGTDNALSESSYGFSPISRIRTLLEWIHRGSWLGGISVDLVADDMTRRGIEQTSTMQPGEVQKIDQAASRLEIWTQIRDNTAWSRLYGGSIGMVMIDGQNPSTPLRVDTIGKGQFRGILVLDRWQVEPSLSDLVQDNGPHLGLPKFYTVNNDAPAMRSMKIHHSRVAFRQEGIRLPYWQRVQENLWGVSVLERLYDRMVGFDSATTGMLQLVYKSYLRTLKLKGFREAVAAGGPALDGVTKQVDMMRRFQSQEGISIIDGDDEFDVQDHGSFAGIAEVLLQAGQQLAGALQIPLVRLFGQSPAGLNSTGDSDLATYYEGILKAQEKDLRPGVDLTYRCIAKSEGIVLPDDWNFQFQSLMTMSSKDKADVANAITDAIIKPYDSGIITNRGVALKELRESSRITGVWSNITDEMIEEAENEPPPSEFGMMPGAEGEGGDLGEQPQGNAKPMQRAANSNEAAPPEEERKGSTVGGKGGANDKGRRMRDSILSQPIDWNGLTLRIETPKGGLRLGNGWSTVMSADYGFIEDTASAEGPNEEMDCFLGPHPESPNVFVIDQAWPDTGVFDEHKCMLGFHRQGDAMSAYLQAFHDGRAHERMSAVTPCTVDEFSDWLQNGDVTKPFASRAVDCGGAADCGCANCRQPGLLPA